MRALQKKLGIDDDMLLTAAGVSDEKEMIKRQIAKYESHVISSPPAPTPPPNTVTRTRPVSLNAATGSVTLQPGSQLRVISRHGDKVWLRYFITDYEIPASATDLAK